MERRERSKADVIAACNVGLPKKRANLLYVDLSKSSAFSFFQTARQYLSQCCFLLRFESPSSAEGRLHAQAQEEIQMLDDFVQQRLQE